MYFNNFYARTYFADDYWGVIGIVEQAPLAGWGGGISNENEEDDIYCLTQAILLVMRVNNER